MRASKLSEIDRAALRRAAAQGWLTLTPDLGEAALTVWRRECARAKWPFAVARPEPKRATVWLALPPERAWGDHEQQLVRDGLTDAAGIVLCPAGVRAFVPLGAEQAIMPRLLALALAAGAADQGLRV
jgi:hypothetical protein